MAREINLQRGLVTIVDDEDYPMLIAYKWYAVRSSSNLYVQRFAVDENGKKHCIRMSRQILGLDRNDKRVADHINRNTLDNRRSNLRACTNAQNRWNSPVNRASKSGLKGVFYSPLHGTEKCWRAQIWANSKRINLGRFHTSEEAYAAYCKAARQYHGEFVCQAVTQGM